MSLTTLFPASGECSQLAMAAHCRRVSVASAEIAARLGWSAASKHQLKSIAEFHHDEGCPPNSKQLGRILARIWTETPIDRLIGNGAAPAEVARLIEFCCLFVQRWEYMPYELLTFEEIMGELRLLAADGFLEAGHVETLANVPAVSLQDVSEVTSKLPVFPAVALRAMEVSRNPMASASHVEDIVMADAVLAGEVLKAANSARYSPAMPIRTIRQAVIHVGLPECCRILAAAAFRPMYQSELVRPLWMHSLEVANLSEWIARCSRLADPEEAFLAGLMHDIGRLALWRLPAHLSYKYANLLDLGCEAMFAEVLLCGMDHAIAGGEVLRRWKLPQPLVDAIKNHHQPERSGVLACVLYLAEHWSGSQEDLPSFARLREALARTHLTMEQLSGLPDAAGTVLD